MDRKEDNYRKPYTWLGNRSSRYRRFPNELGPIGTETYVRELVYKVSDFNDKRSGIKFEHVGTKSFLRYVEVQKQSILKFLLEFTESHRLNVLFYHVINNNFGFVRTRSVCACVSANTGNARGKRFFFLSKNRFLSCFRPYTCVQQRERGEEIKQ